MTSRGCNRLRLSVMYDSHSQPLSYTHLLALLQHASGESAWFPLGVPPSLKVETVDDQQHSSYNPREARVLRSSHTWCSHGVVSLHNVSVYDIHTYIHVMLMLQNVPERGVHPFKCKGVKPESPVCSSRSPGPPWNTLQVTDSLCQSIQMHSVCNISSHVSHKVQ